MFSSIHEECGVFGVYTQNPESDVADQTYFALFALQHRGQESTGIAVNNHGVIRYHRDIGLVPEVYTQDILENRLGRGNIALGHTRYSKAMDSAHSRSFAQPIVVKHIKGNMALAHNGALTNGIDLREDLEMNGAIFHTTTDSEVMSYVITRARVQTASMEHAVERAMYDIKGAYSLLVMSPTKLIAARDPLGFRPLCMGERDGDIIFASESCALDNLGATFIRDIEPGEIVVVGPEGIESIRTHCTGKSAMCVFEFVYFSRPDSTIEGANVHMSRVNAGARLFEEHPIEADIVIGAPDSGLDGALGFSRASGIPYGIGFIKNRYIARTFIKPTQKQRENAVRIKLNVIKEVVAGKRVVLIDDSIVRGTTSGWIVQLLKEAGATEVHMRISAPPFKHPCYFGTDIDSKEELIAHKMTIPEIEKYIGADSLGYLSVEGVQAVVENAKCNFCVGCFTGKYPMPVPDKKRVSKYENESSREGAE